MEKSKYSSGFLIELDNEFTAHLTTLEVRISYYCPDIPLQSSPERQFSLDCLLTPDGNCNCHSNGLCCICIWNNSSSREGCLIVRRKSAVVLDHILVTTN